MGKIVVPACLIIVAAICAIIPLTALRASAQTEKVLYSFNAKSGAYEPVSTLVFDGVGNLYGTTQDGGAYGYGTVFELSPAAGGNWTEKVLHSFGNAKDGDAPQAGVILDGAGNLYGTALYGGQYNYGIVFELSPASGGRWTEKILHNFNDNGKDGNTPYGALVFDALGNLYGTASFGGAYSGIIGSPVGGTVFQLAPQAGGGWSEKTLHNFGNGLDGSYPQGNLIFDASGNLYGTTAYGGSHGNGGDGDWGYGTVFELSPRENGSWSEAILHNFGSDGDGENPQSGLVFDASGDLYGTTLWGGAWNGLQACCGAVFELTRTTEGWEERLLHKFVANGTDGDSPSGSVAFDGSGNLYGTTSGGGDSGDSGMVFKLTPAASGPWVETVVQDFDGPDGIAPLGGGIFDAAGNFYGVTFAGGSHWGGDSAGGGTVYEITP